MPQSNFQDVVVLNDATLSVLGQQIALGSDAGAKSLVLSNDVGAIHFAGNATGAGNRTVNLPDANGTVGLITALSAGTTLASNGQVVFSNSNNISFGLNGNTLTASFAQSTQPGVTAIGVSTGGNTLGNTGTTQGTVVFAGLGIVTLSQSTAAGSLATINISATQSTGPAALAAGTQTGTSGTFFFNNSNGISFGMSGSTQITATADYVRSISAGTTNATGNQIVFSNSNGVSFGANGATITASVAAGVRVTAFSQWAEFGTNASISHGSLLLQKVSSPVSISATQAAIMMDLNAGATGSQSTGALTVSMGVYTLAGSTASLASSGSRVISWTSGSETSASSRYGGVSGTRYRTIGINLNITPGDYLIAYHFQTANIDKWRVMGRQAVNIVGTYDGFETGYFIDGYSTSSFNSAMPASIVATNTNYVRTGLPALRQPGVILVGSF
jgi:hypothetical protein